MKSSAAKAELYYRKDLSTLGEGPVWDAGVLYWVDIFEKLIYVKPDDAAAAERYEVGVEVGALVPWENRRLVLATAQGFQSFDMTARRLEAWANPEPSLPDNRFNDGKCDPVGRFIAGTYNRNGVAEQGALYVLDHDRSVREIYRPVSCSNGLAWTEPGTLVYYIDTATGVVRAFTYDLETAKLSNERVVIELPKNGGLPDGMCIDREGNLWIGLWGGWGVECWSPASGKRLARIEIPAANVTSCAFGGANYDTLYITTARHGVDPATRARQELAGSVFCVRPGVSGYPAVHYKGDRR